MLVLQSKKMKVVLIAIVWLFVALMMVTPLIFVFTKAFQNGVGSYVKAITDVFTLAALKLTLEATVISVVFNTIFGISAAWVISFYDFKGKRLLNTLIDLPFSVSPVIAGLIFVLTFGRIGWAAPLLEKINVQIIFAPPAIFLATIFVTFPFVARELIPSLSVRGREEEQTAAFLGGNFWTIFKEVTYPAIKKPLFYGLVLATARSMGEFGAVSVVSGNLRGQTLTLPLLVETLYNEFKISDAFAVATILVFFSFVIMFIKWWFNREKNEVK
jgi:sulfate transport system permease protein